MPKRTRSYSAWQLEKLSNPELAAQYLNSALLDSQEMFLVALRKVAQAKEMASVAREAGVQRETLYNALSPKGNPTWNTLRSVLSVLGMEVQILSKSASVSMPQAPVPTPARLENAGALTKYYPATGSGSFATTYLRSYWQQGTLMVSAQSEGQKTYTGIPVGQIVVAALT